MLSDHLQVNEVDSHQAQRFLDGIIITKALVPEAIDLFRILSGRVQDDSNFRIDDYCPENVPEIKTNVTKVN